MNTILSMRIRIGPFTVGRSGVRLSIWKKGSGVSVPITGKGRKRRGGFGSVKLGPFRWWFRSR